jgi:hypothetical protein
MGADYLRFAHLGCDLTSRQTSPAQDLPTAALRRNFIIGEFESEAAIMEGAKNVLSAGASTLGNRLLLGLEHFKQF